MKLKHLSALVIALMLVTAVPAIAAGYFTIGDFVQELARVKNVNATDARIAGDSLRAIGIQLPADLDMSAALTEGTVVDISKAAGLRVSTNNPSAAFRADQVEGFFSAFAGELTGPAVGHNEEERQTKVRDPNKFDPFTKGKGNHYAKGHRSPTEPE